LRGDLEKGIYKIYWFMTRCDRRQFPTKLCHDFAHTQHKHGVDRQLNRCHFVMSRIAVKGTADIKNRSGAYTLYHDTINLFQQSLSHASMSNPSQQTVCPGILRDCVSAKQIYRTKKTME
jgi:hypothetical protein